VFRAHGGAKAVPDGDKVLNGARAQQGVGASDVSVTFEHADFPVAEARHFALRFLAGLPASGPPVPPRTAEAVQLVVSELVTNAIKYGSPPVELSLAVAQGVLSITVRDREPVMPAQRAAGPTRVGQHGLEIVAALSLDIDIQGEPGGKRVTARIAL